MNNKIAVGEYGYAVDGNAYEVVAHVQGGYIAAPVYEDDSNEGSGGGYVDDNNPVRIAKLFANPPTEKYSEEIRQLRETLSDLKRQEKEKKDALCSLKAEISRAEQVKKEIAIEFPFLETALKVQRGELEYFVQPRGFSDVLYRVAPVNPPWGENYPDALCIASFTIDRKGKKPLSISSKIQFFASEQEAKEFAKVKTIEALHGLAQGEHSNHIEELIKEAKNIGIAVPASVMKRKLTKDLNGELASVERYIGYASDSTAKAEELKAQIAALEDAE